jgi:hypothetical protein
MKWLDTRGNTVLTIVICSRCKFKRSYDDTENDQNFPGLRVCKFGCNDNKDPYRLKMRQPEKIAVRFPRPDEPVGTSSVLPVSTTGLDATGVPLQSLETTVTEDTNVNQYTYSPPLFNVTSITPNSGTSGTVVNLYGNGLSGSTSVYFGNMPSTYIIVNNNQIQATAPNNAKGSVPIAITNTYGVATSSFNYL